ncbi:endonuclease/exonuclease/phosphatase family protein [Streptomyces sp. XD-27]|uniref:endonuclease/exonuclease/phosphatase family protein n=1 Tax=Streptomyces sp. XD-27 TaxID=3062779 RepID=UPI0026F45C58|nr:endonuclease/exonuclease/phosphatase family protein [Streptomyces sp. XD-27]WKX74285.1 endonuclease/exonuclease/phosphatase family protein [Streptomyces sp. XD-27]
MRVLTWNVWWLFGAWERRREAIAAVLRDARPDVIGLQEVWARGDENLAEWLARRLSRDLDDEWTWTWASSKVPGRWRKRIADGAAETAEVGNAVLSRWPIADRAVLTLPTAGGEDEGRLALYARIDAPGAPVPFFTAHLNHAVHESAVRCAQVAALARFVADHRGGTDFPPVVTGDFNARPDSDEIRLLGGHRTAPALPGQVLVDAWEYADPAAPAATWDRANPHVAESFEPSARIDYVHVGLPGPDGLGRVRAVRRAGDAPVAGVWPSDHAAVVADLAPA